MQSGLYFVPPFYRYTVFVCQKSMSGIIWLCPVFYKPLTAKIERNERYV